MNHDRCDLVDRAWVTAGERLQARWGELRAQFHFGTDSDEEWDALMKDPEWADHIALTRLVQGSGGGR